MEMVSFHFLRAITTAAESKAVASVDHSPWRIALETALQMISSVNAHILCRALRIWT
jgi:hypothetical protein